MGSKWEKTESSGKLTEATERGREMKKKKVIALRILGVIFFLAGVIAAMAFYKEGFTTWVIAAAIAVGIVFGERCLHHANKIVQRKG